MALSWLPEPAPGSESRQIFGDLKLSGRMIFSETFSSISIPANLLNYRRRIRADKSRRFASASSRRPSPVFPWKMGKTVKPKPIYRRPKSLGRKPTEPMDPEVVYEISDVSGTPCHCQGFFRRHQHFGKAGGQEKEIKRDFPGRPAHRTTMVSLQNISAIWPLKKRKK